MERWFRLSQFNILAIVFLIGCSGPRHVKFSSPVDTRSKLVSDPIKQVFSISELGVYATNNFDGARLNNFKKINDSTIALVIKPENTPINKSPYYAFKTWSDSPRTIYFQFDYPIGFKHRYLPKLKKLDQDWTKADSADVFFNDTIATLRMKINKDTTLLAAQKLFTSKDVKVWYSGLVKKHSLLINLKSAGRSTLGRNIPFLDIHSGSILGKDIIVLLTRQHPPEVTGYMAFQSFLETILDGSPLSNSFLNNYRILAFPIMNPDGVDLGHWRHNASGVDLNRDWSYYRQPEIRQVVDAIETTIKEDNGRIILGLDFHSTWHDVFYTNPQREETTLPNFITKWFAGLEANIPDYKVNEQSNDSSKPVSKGWFLKRFNAVGITYEIGDNTHRDFIKLKGKVSATEMMKILLNTLNN